MELQEGARGAIGGQSVARHSGDMSLLPDSEERRVNHVGGLTAPVDEAELSEADFALVNRSTSSPRWWKPASLGALLLASLLAAGMVHGFGRHEVVKSLINAGRLVLGW